MSMLKITDAVKKFNGSAEEDVDQWLARFETAAKILSTEDDAGRKKEMATMMPLLLDGPAFNTWQQLGDAEKNDVSTIMAALRRVFGMGKVAAWQRLKSLRLFPGESVDVLVTEVKTLLRTITTDDAPEELVSLFLLDALPQNIAEQARLHFGEQLVLKDVLSCAKALLATSSDQLAALGSRGRAPTSRGDSTKCYRCGRSGHVARNCYKCYRCGQAGHLQRNCPVPQDPRPTRLDEKGEAGNDRAWAGSPDLAARAN
jgi:hypothetical protein